MFIEFEEIFDEFIKSVGGELIRDLLPQDAKSEHNADYIFRDQQIIVELKCSITDHYYHPDAQQQFRKNLKKALVKGYLSEKEVVELFQEKNGVKV
jgi:hypothetical protein